ncbi:MAG: AAA family ATPase, partial [Chitinophagaceae bacterium]
MLNFTKTLTMEQKPKPSSTGKLKMTANSWSDFTAHKILIDEVKPVQQWLRQHYEANPAAERAFASNHYVVLFDGADPAAKLNAAALLAKEANKELRRVDLSAVVSRYINETEKNLDKVFRQAEETNCILFFDEADALFGKRTTIRDAHDK